MRKKGVKILITTRHYLPAYLAGGPIQTIAAFSHYLKEYFDIYIHSTNRDSVINSEFKGIPLNSWITTKDSKNYYSDKHGVSISSLYRVIKDLSPDVIYISSFFDHVFTVKILILRRLGLIDKSISVILATRGEFAQSALLQNNIKKRIYIIFFKLFKVYDGINYHVSSSLEHNDLTKVFNTHQYNKIFVLNDLSLMNPIGMQAKIKAMNKSAKTLKMCFVSRISQVKNLDYALQILSRVKASVVFDIYGPISNNSYWAQCERIIEKMPEHVNVNYHGSVKHDAVQSTISKYDMFFLPTKGENFGHIIIEALSSATPVLISDNTQWNDIVQYNSGWAIPLPRSDKFIETIDMFATLDLSNRRKFFKSSLEYYTEKMNQTLLIENYRQAFDHIEK